MKAFIDQFERLTQALADPEYLFLVLEPMLFYGIALGVICLIVTCFLKSARLQSAALVLLIVSALSILPYLGARQTAEKRIEKVYQVEYPARVKAFTANTRDRIDHQWVYLGLAGIAGVALLVGPRRNRLGLGFAIVSVAIGLYAANYSLWMHYQDSLAFHPNLKTNDSPVQEKLRAKPVDEPESTPTPSALPDREVRPLAKRVEF